MNVGDDIVEEDLSLRDDIVEIPDEGLQQETRVDQAEQTKASSEILLEFLEVAVHQILYSRKLYTEEIFLLRKKYNVPVRISSHPGLNNYISSSLSSLKNLFLENRIAHISVLIKDEGRPLENFLFEVQMLKDALSKGQEFIELEQALRSFLLKILSSSSSLDHLPETCSFEILVGCNADCEVDLNVTDDENSMKWTLVDKADFARTIKPDRLLPVKALNGSSAFNLQLVVEQMVQPGS